MNKAFMLALGFGFLAAIEWKRGEFDFKQMKKWPVWILSALEMAAGAALFCTVLFFLNQKIHLDSGWVFIGALTVSYLWTKIRRASLIQAFFLTAACFLAFQSSIDYLGQLRFTAVFTTYFFAFRFLLEGVKFRLALTPFHRDVHGLVALLFAAFFLALVFSGLRPFLQI
jgi:hypothetical protein